MLCVLFISNIRQRLTLKTLDVWNVQEPDTAVRDTVYLNFLPNVVRRKVHHKKLILVPNPESLGNLCRRPGNSFCFKKITVSLNNLSCQQWPDSSSLKTA